MTRRGAAACCEPFGSILTPMTSIISRGGLSACANLFPFLLFLYYTIWRVQVGERHFLATLATAGQLGAVELIPQVELRFVPLHLPVFIEQAWINVNCRHLGHPNCELPSLPAPHCKAYIYM